MMPAEITTTDLDDNLPQLPPPHDQEDTIVLLPHVVQEDGKPVFSQSTKSVLKRFGKEAVKARLGTDRNDDVSFRDERGLEWLGPVIWIGTALWSSNPEAVSVAMNVISAYVYDVFKGREHETVAKLTVFVENKKKGSATRITYRGPVSGLAELKSAVIKACEKK